MVESLSTKTTLGAKISPPPIPIFSTNIKNKTNPKNRQQQSNNNNNQILN